MNLGIDIGGATVKAAALRDGRVIWTSQSPPYDRPATAQLIDAIRVAIGGRPGPFEAVGLCVPGLMDRAGRRITLSVNVPGLVGIGLDDLVAAALGGGAAGAGRVGIFNDAQAMAADIFVTRALRGRLLILALGTGVGAAVLDDGRPLIVEGESPGHVGQFDVSLADEPRLAPDGGAGGLEGYIGSPALARRYGPDVSTAIASLRGDEPPIRALARAIRICHAIYRPDHICLTGGIGIRLGHLIPSLRRQIEQNLTSIAKPDWTLTTGDNDFHAAVGAARLA